jgi:hypothetical protein
MLTRRVVRLIAVVSIAGLANTGCMLSRAVDRAFLGMTVRRPNFDARKTTGLFLLPLTFAVDVATFPIQALLVVILGDNFPFTEAEQLNQMYALNEHPQMQKLSPERRAVAIRELEQLLRSGHINRHSSLALTEEGHWVVTALTEEARSQLLARATENPLETPAVCVR